MHRVLNIDSDMLGLDGVRVKVFIEPLVEESNLSISTLFGLMMV